MSLALITCTLTVKDILGAAFTTAELVCEPRKTQVNSGDAAYISRPKRASANGSGVCTLILAETTTNNQLVTFSLNWDDAGKSAGQVIFDPVLIPASPSSLDLSTLLTVAKG